MCKYVMMDIGIGYVVVNRVGENGTLSFKASSFNFDVAYLYTRA